MRTTALAFVMLVLAAPDSVQAQEALSIEPVTGGLYTVLRSGTNIGVRLGPEGVIVIDQGYPDRFDEIEELVGQVTDLPVTHVLSAKTTVAPDRVRKYGPGQPEYQTAVHMGGLDVRAVYVGPADAEATAVIHFPDLRAVLGGDVLNRTAPLVDYADGGSTRDWIGSLDNLLALDFETAIPERGALMDRADVERFRHLMEGIRTHMTELGRSVAFRVSMGDPIRTPDPGSGRHGGGLVMGSLPGVRQTSCATSRP